MPKTILVAGATGDLGGRIIRELKQRGAEVRALVRPGTDKAKLDKLDAAGAKIYEAALADKPALAQACEGVGCVVSTLQGLREVIVEAQVAILDAAVAAGVPHFIPSDYASDFTKQPKGQNRNFDLRIEFNEYMAKQPIKGTSVLNGAFAELLNYNIPFLNFKDKTVGYWENADWKVDFTTKDNVAAFTAAASLDSDAPRILRIAGIQISANEMLAAASEILHTPFKLVRMGSLAELAAYNIRERAAHPEGENEIYPKWQQSQYTQSMFTVQLSPLDNDRYPGIKWAGLKDVIGGR